MALDHSSKLKDELVEAHAVARKGAEARFGLHSLGLQVRPDSRNVDDYVKSLEESQQKRDTLMKQLASDRDSVRTGPKLESTFQDLVRKMDRCEVEAKDLKDLSMQLRIEMSVSYRKQQDAVWTTVKARMPQATFHWPDKLQVSEETLKLERAKRMMIQELNDLQGTFRFRMSDVDVIFQSVQSGILVSEQASVYETHRALLTSVERILRQVTDWQTRMTAILV